MSRPKTGASTGRKALKPTGRTAARPDSKVVPESRAETRAAKPPPASQKLSTSAERERLRALLPPLDARYAKMWDRGAAKAYTSRAAGPLRVSVRSAHKKRLTDIEKRTGLDRQVILNRAVEAGWQALHMNGTELEAAATKLRRQPSAAGGTVSLYPTAATLQIFRTANHPHAKAILLQTGLNVWKAAS